LDIRRTATPKEVATPSATPKEEVRDSGDNELVDKGVCISTKISSEEIGISNECGN
jgi:hypothetical protein